MKIKVFEKGKQYKDRLGRFLTVTEITLDKILFCYDHDGEVKTIGKELAPLVFQKIGKTETLEASWSGEMARLKETMYDPNNVDNHVRWHFIGYLAKNCQITFSGKEEHRDKFHKIVAKATGLKADDTHFYETACQNRWGLSAKLMVVKPAGVPLDYLCELVPVMVVPGHPNHIAIYKTEYVLSLLQLGFRLGDKHDIDELGYSAPAMFHDSFKQGLTAKRREANEMDKS